MSSLVPTGRYPLGISLVIFTLSFGGCNLKHYRKFSQPKGTLLLSCNKKYQHINKIRSNCSNRALNSDVGLSSPQSVCLSICIEKATFKELNKLCFLVGEQCIGPVLDSSIYLLVCTTILWSMPLILYRSTVWWSLDVEPAQYAFSCLSLLSLSPSFIDHLTDKVSLLVDRQAILWKCEGVKPHLYRADTTTHICSCCLYWVVCQDSSTPNLSKQLNSNPKTGMKIDCDWICVCPCNKLHRREYSTQPQSLKWIRHCVNTLVMVKPINRWLRAGTLWLLMALPSTWAPAELASLGVSVVNDLDS